MATDLALDPTLTPAVEKFVEQHDAREAFRSIVDLVRDCFPQARGIRAELRDDVDEEGRNRVAILVLVTSDTTISELHKQIRDYHERMVVLVPLAKAILFVLTTQYVPR